MDTQESPSKIVSATSSVLSFVILVAALTVIVSLMASSANASSLGPSNAQRRALALVEAHHLLTLATLPAGSTKLAAWIASDGSALSSSSPRSGDPDQADLTEYFLVPGGVTARRWLDAQTPSGGRISGTGSSSGPGSDDVTFTSFSFHSATTFLSPELQYSMLITPKGDLGLRVDADVSWTQRKSPYSIVAPGAVKVVVIVQRGLNTERGAVTSRTTLNSTIIRRFIAHVNELPAALVGVHSCPMDDGATLTLRFFDVGATLPYAVVSADATGCGTVKMFQYGADDTLIGTANVAGGSSLATYVATTIGIANWNGLQPK